MSTFLENPFRNEEKVVWRQGREVIVVFDYHQGSVYHLNSLAACIWQICDGSHSITEIGEILKKKFNKTCPRADICHLLEELSELALIRWKD